MFGPYERYCAACLIWKSSRSFLRATDFICIPCQHLSWERDRLVREYGEPTAAEKTRRLTELKRQRGCQRCGESESVCLDFHHVQREEKQFNLSLRSAPRYPWHEVEAEIAKCVILCANCHRKLHAGHWSFPSPSSQ